MKDIAYIIVKILFFVVGLPITLIGITGDVMHYFAREYMEAWEKIQRIMTKK